VKVEVAELDAAELAEEQTLNATERVKLALEAGPAFQMEIADTTELKLQTVKNALSKLRRSGDVEDTGKMDEQSKQVSLMSPHYKDGDQDTHGPDGKRRELQASLDDENKRA